MATNFIFLQSVLFGVVFIFSIMGALSSMYFSKKQRDASGPLGKASKLRDEFVSTTVNGIENVKGLALEPGLKDAWRDVEANYILEAENVQKKQPMQKSYIYH